MPQLKIHPLCQEVPEMTAGEFADLKASIKKDGLQYQIVSHENMILDGRHRYQACLEAGVKPVIVPYSGKDPAAFVMMMNVTRRQLSPGQRAAYVASKTDYSHVNGIGQTLQIGNVADLGTVGKRADTSGVGLRTQSKADLVAKADPALLKEVIAGTTSLESAVKKVGGGKKTEPAKPKPEKPKKPEPEAIDGELSAGELLENQETIIRRLQEDIASLSATDVAAELKKNIDMRRYAVAEKAAEMSKNATYQARIKDLERFRNRVLDLTGAANPREAVEILKATKFAKGK